MRNNSALQTILFYHCNAIHNPRNLLNMLKYDNIRRMHKLIKDVGHFLWAQCLYPNNVCKMSRISIEPYFYPTNGSLQNWNFWSISSDIQGVRIYHRPLWAKNINPYFT